MSIGTNRWDYSLGRRIGAAILVAAGLSTPSALGTDFSITAASPTPLADASTLRTIGGVATVIITPPPVVTGIDAFSYGVDRILPTATSGLTVVIRYSVTPGTVGAMGSVILIESAAHTDGAAGDFFEATTSVGVGSFTAATLFADDRGPSMQR